MTYTIAALILTLTAALLGVWLAWEPAAVQSGETVQPAVAAVLIPVAW